MNSLFIEGVRIHRNHPAFSGSYLSGIPSLQETETLTFHSPVTFFTGENGSGKSTLLEAIAVACRLNPEGGTRNFTFSTYDDVSPLSDAITLLRGVRHAQWSYFLRAESFYNVVTTANREYEGGFRMPDYHSCSHGESFLSFIQENAKTGLYLMDEPEAALSPQNQLTLLLLLHRMAGAGSQFLIATHSPILLGVPDAEILSFDDGAIHAIGYDESPCCQITKMFMNSREQLLRQLLSEETD